MLNLDNVLIDENISIFILEDTLLFQKKMKVDLFKIGFRGKITCVGTVREAFASLVNEKPNLILSDWNLPDGNGLDILKITRSEVQLSQVPFLMVTTMGEIENILKAIDNGVDGYIVKPWDIPELIEKIAFAFDKHRENS